MFVARLSIYFAVFLNALTITFVYPFGSQMVQTFGMAADRSHTGYWVGILAFSFMFARLVSSPFWGSKCDTWGRRPVALLSISSVFIFSLSLGLSGNYWWALFSRFSLGLLCSLILVGRISITEVTNSSPSAMAKTVISAQIGSLSGNIIGGVFVDPVKSGLSKWSVFNDYPFLLPNLIVSGLSLVNLAMWYFFMPETLTKGPHTEKRELRSYKDMLKDPLIRWLCMLYTLLVSLGAGFNELITLWCWADIENGGFEMSPIEIGNLLALSASILIVFEAPIYNFLKRRMRITAMTRCFIIVKVLIMALIPLNTLLNKTKFAKYISLGFFSLCWYISMFINVTNMNVMQNNCVGKDERGKMSALFIISNSIARAAAPLMFGSIFAWSATGGFPYPLDFSLSFNLIAVVSALLGVLSLNRCIDSLEEPMLVNDTVELESLEKDDLTVK